MLSWSLIRLQRIHSGNSLKTIHNVSVSNIRNSERESGLTYPAGCGGAAALAGSAILPCRQTLGLRFTLETSLLR